MGNSRLKTTVVRGLVVAFLFFLIRLLLNLLPGRADESLTTSVLLSVGVGALWGVVTWLRWPAEQRRLGADRQR